MMSPKNNFIKNDVTENDVIKEWRHKKVSLFITNNLNWLKK